MADSTPEPGARQNPCVLLVDDEDSFRLAVRQQLSVRGYDVLDVNNGRDAIRVVRHENPEVVVLDLKMPGMDGVQTLKEIKRVRPEVQVILLTGFASTESAQASGRHDVFKYLHKPCDLPTLIDAIEAARQERVYAMGRQEIPRVERGGLWTWLAGAPNARPGLILLAAVLFGAILAAPTPARLTRLLSAAKTGAPGDPVAGHADYRKMAVGQSIAGHFARKSGLAARLGPDAGPAALVDAVGFRARVMVGVLVVAVLFWATAAIPVGMTALLVGVLMYFFGVLPPDQVAKAFAKDSVVFIFGVLVISTAITKTGLDRRIGLLLLGTSTSLARLAFIFCPLLAVTASFVSEHALVAFLAPIFVMAYTGVVQAARIRRDPQLAVMLLLMLTFAANTGGPGSPAAGGRNAVMLGILADYGVTPTFGQWVLYGLPAVPVLALATAGYFYLTFRRRIRTPRVNVAEEIRREAEKIGPMTRQEHITAAVLVLLIVLWCAFSSRFGMGGPVILCIVLLNILGVLRWRDVNSIHWDVVALYAAASAMGAGLAGAGTALWLADGFVGLLPEALKTGEGLAMSTSVLSGLATNFMSDGAAVAAIGPITVPMATLSGTPPLMIGLATAFSSSFAFLFVIGTPNNAIAYSVARDPETGEQLLTMRDFFRHGLVVWVLSLLVLWGWVFLGYWRWIGF